MPVAITSLKDLLLPGVWGRNADADLRIDYANDRIMLIKNGNNHELLTRKDIDDNVWKDVFAKRLDEILGPATGEK